METIERGSTQWFQAWRLLKAHILGDNVGKGINDYMLMYADGPRVYFKHIDTRQYVRVNLDLQACYPQVS